MPPAPKGAAHGPVQFKNLKKGTIKRLLQLLRPYRLHMLVVAVCIIASALAGTVTMTYMETIIDDHIKPMLLSGSSDFSGLIRSITEMAVLFGVSIVAVAVQGIIMATVSQGALRNIRNQMFTHMQTLPIKYFDTHTFGNTMSHFTNDTDTLRQMLSQSIPQLLSSLMTIVTVFIAMVMNNVILTVFVLLTIAAMMVVTVKVGGNSAKYFGAQQKSLGEVNG